MDQRSGEPSGNPGPAPDVEQAIATLYAPAAARAPIDLLWRIDRRLEQVRAAGTDPMLTTLRLAWWREELAELGRRPAGEPLLLAAADLLLPHVDGATLADIAEGWGAIGADADDAALEAHGRLRGGALFAAAARVAGGEDGEDLRLAGAGWALVDLACGIADVAAAARARAAAIGPLDRWSGRTVPRLRFLGALAVLARRDVRTAQRAQGGPGRLTRIAVYRLTGR